MRILTLMIACATFLAFGAGLAQADTARLQVIHNAADPAAETVDIYVNGDLFLDDFAFRAATPFVDVPAGVNLNIGVAPADSDDAGDVIADFDVTLATDQRYVAIANGVLTPGIFSPNPDGMDIGFNLFARDGIFENAPWGLVRLVAFHGATDAPTVDIIRTNGFFDWPIFRNLSYGEFSSYRYLLPTTYTLAVTPAGDNDSVVAEYEVDLSALAGGAAVVFASGFLTPGDDVDGPAFGLFAALPDGTVLPLTATSQMARLQVIHNAADPGAEMVDIYVNGDLLLDDFAFRAATPFIDVPAGVNLNIGVAPPDSDDAGDVIADFDVTLAAGETYVAVANGVLNPGGFADNPDGRSIAFNLYPRDDVSENGYFGLTKVMAFHGATDAPGVDIKVRSSWGRWSLFEDLSYGDYSPYRTLYPREYSIELTPADDDVVIATFEADLSGLGNGAAVVFASGFLSPADNQDGAAFGLFAALPNGTVVEFPAVTPMARLQVIHNAADPAAEMVDIYVNGDLLLDDFAFRAATPFVDVPAGVNLNIGVAPPDSDDAGDVIADFDVTLEPAQRYVAIANGVLDPGGFGENPDGMDIGFNLFARGKVYESFLPGWVRLIAFHGATDAPSVDVRLNTPWGSWPVFPNLSYGEYSRYRMLPDESYVLDITPAGDPESIVVSYDVDLSGLGGGAAVVFASGFLSPDDDQDGAAFGLFAALPNGTVVEFPVAGPDAFLNENAASVPMANTLGQNFPNPFNPTTTFAFSLASAGKVSLKVFDVGGRLVETVINDTMSAGEHRVDFNARDMASGTYFYRIQADDFTETRRMVLLK